MKQHQKLTCPVCGMQVWPRNLKRFHSVKRWLVTFGGRGRIEHKEIDTENYLYDFWIRRLEEVLAWLKKEKETKEKGIYHPKYIEKEGEGVIHPKLIENAGKDDK